MGNRKERAIMKETETNEALLKTSIGEINKMLSRGKRIAIFALASTIFSLFIIFVFFSAGERVGILFGFVMLTMNLYTFDYMVYYVRKLSWVKSVKTNEGLS